MEVHQNKMMRMNHVNVYDMMENKYNNTTMEDANKHYADKAKQHFKHKPYANDFK